MLLRRVQQVACGVVLKQLVGRNTLAVLALAALQAAQGVILVVENALLAVLALQLFNSDRTSVMR
jgi:hypothetical protein